MNAVGGTRLYTTTSRLTSNDAKDPCIIDILEHLMIRINCNAINTAPA